MHQMVYQHRVAIVAEAMIGIALLAAFTHFAYHGDVASLVTCRDFHTGHDPMHF